MLGSELVKLQLLRIRGSDGEMCLMDYEQCPTNPFHQLLICLMFPGDALRLGPTGIRL